MTNKNGPATNANSSGSFSYRKVIGTVASTEAVGIYGANDADSGNGYAIYGETTVPGGTAIHGTGAAVSGGVGVRGDAGASGFGLFTPDSARVDGDMITGTSWQVFVDGDRALYLGSENLGDGGTVVAGHSDNANSSGAVGAAIGGGGASGVPNKVTDEFGTVGGGRENQAGDVGDDPTTATFATVGGGERNEAKNFHATVGGGFDNEASGRQSTVGGGDDNSAAGGEATVGGGFN